LSSVSKPCALGFWGLSPLCQCRPLFVLSTSLDVSWIILEALARRGLSFCASSVYGPPSGEPAPETNPCDRTLRYMMPDFTIALAIGLVIGFITGYGLRAIISYRRRRRARRRSYLF